LLSKLRYLIRSPKRLIAAVRSGKDVNVERYIRAAPLPQNAVDLFKGLWWSRLPDEFNVSAGRTEHFADVRTQRAIEALGGVSGKSVLELGPMEGGHTYMLERAGARSVLAIEADAHSFLRCLIAKEVTGLQRSRFLLGDFEVYLREATQHFDAALASGVLYHVTRPIELIRNLARVCDQIYFWTHYHDAERLRRNEHMAHRFRPGEASEWGGFVFTAHRYEYGDFLQQPRFAGGTGQFAIWLSREDFLGALRFHGLTEIVILSDEPDHVNGPAISLVASRPRADESKAS
jgi:SAM-dependent methyltransferase